MVSFTPGLVTIIIPCFNASSTITETLSSVIRQSYSDFQCIIVDDCSTDNTCSVIEGIIAGDSRFLLHRSPDNIGVSLSRNLGLSFCKGEFISFLDADDLWHPDFLSASISLLSSGYKFVYSPVLRFFDNPHRPSFLKLPPLRVKLFSLLQNNHLPLLSCVFRSEILPSTIRFPQQRMEDYIFWIKLFKANNGLTAFRTSTKPLAYYRISPTQRSSNKLPTLKRVYFIYRSIWNYNRMASLCLVIFYSMNSILDAVKQYLSRRSFPYYFF